MTQVGLVVFDVGGTTIYDTADVAGVFASALDQYGISASPERLRSWRGASKRKVIKELVRAGAGVRPDPSEVYRTFQDLLIDAFTARGVEAIPGVEAAMGCLRENEVQVVLATGFDARIMGFVLGHLGWDNVVDGVVTSDDVVRGRPAPDLIFAAMQRAGVKPTDAVVAVGDTQNDLRAANAAGVGASIGVLTGAHERARLSEVQHTVILASAEEVPQWLADRRWSAA